MSDKMVPIPLKKMLKWIFAEYTNHRKILGIPESAFFKDEKKSWNIAGDVISTPVGPAAGPHTQLAQNIISAYLTGARFFELKTVQIKDSLEIEKPCIDANDEAYNSEWSTELSVEQAMDEYIKAWIIIHLLDSTFFNNRRAFHFNISVGYELNGIQSDKVDNFIETMKNAKNTPIFNLYLDELSDFMNSSEYSDRFLQRDFEEILNGISPNIARSITLSTMHGCPPNEISRICHYLLTEKQLPVYVKLNPTLLGYETVRKILDDSGYKTIQLCANTFTNDLQFDDAISMIKELLKTASATNSAFGVKLSNTLATVNSKKVLSGKEIYMSGKPLFPLTIRLAERLSAMFGENLPISFSGGIDANNIINVLKLGIQPVTFATTLLKPGGYQRIKQIAEKTLSVKKLNGRELKGEYDRLIQNIVLEPKPKHYSVKTSEKIPLWDCAKAPCISGCPTAQKIPEYISDILRKDYNAALQKILIDNPLPNITGEICEQNCITKCTRIDYDYPVRIRALKKMAAQNGKATFSKTKKLSNTKCAVVGAGPAGLSNAYFLSKAGFDVSVFYNELPGGTVANVIPQFRITTEIIKSDLDFLLEMGVKFIQVDSDEESIESLKSSDYKYIFLGIGTSKAKTLKISGDGEIINSIEFLRKFHKSEKFTDWGSEIAVIGGGNSAMDAARAALRLPNTKHVYLVYRRTREFMPADKEEFENALKEGAEFCELLSPVSFNSKGELVLGKMSLTETAINGRKEVTGSGETKKMIVDEVITAIGEQPDENWLKINGVNLVQTDISSLETNIANVFIGGDVLHGPSNIITAVADGKKCAEEILRREGIVRKESEVDTGLDIDYILSKRGYIFNEFEDIHHEAERCLQCNVVCNKCVEVCPNRANIAIHVEHPGLKNYFQIVHLDALCNECGNCATFCPYDGKPYKDKFTVFSTETDFQASDNDGMWIESADSKQYRIRINKKEINPESTVLTPETAAVVSAIRKEYSFII
ncbi:MAG: putative selenate reductase subunit YgfK [Candidatus Cloacimonetes bacterium]|nr:putative selenate reductase subunit YgfK [Candidatus Cloacimonadota bacterium]